MITARPRDGRAPLPTADHEGGGERGHQPYDFTGVGDIDDGGIGAGGSQGTQRRGAQLAVGAGHENKAGGKADPATAGVEGETEHQADAEHRHQQQDRPKNQPGHRAITLS